jgi:hypothetical protein
VWLDSAYDSDVTREYVAERNIDDAIIARKRRKGAPGAKKALPMGLRWPAERINSWLSSFVQLRTNTDRQSVHRFAQVSLAAACLLTAELVDRRNRCSRDLSPIR